MSLQYTSGTFTLTAAASLANGSAAQSAKITTDTSKNTTDYLISIEPTLQTGAPASDKDVEVYAYTSLDNTTFPDGVSGSDAAYTMFSPTNLIPLPFVQTPNSGALKMPQRAASLAAACGGSLPPYWGIVVYNRSGLAFTAFAARYTQVYYTAT